MLDSTLLFKSVETRTQLQLRYLFHPHSLASVAGPATVPTFQGTVITIFNIIHKYLAKGII